MSNLGFSLVILSLLVMFMLARQVHPAKDQHGTKLNGILSKATEPELLPELLEVATYNVQTGKSDQGHRDITRATSVIAGVDIIGVQEVYAAGWLNKLGLGKPQTEALASKGSLSYLFAATRYRWFREQRGNAVLSKLPIFNWRIQMLNDQSRKSPRNMTLVEFEWQGLDVVFINTHLHTGKGRSSQLEQVLDEFSRHSRVILVGDFNTDQSDPILSEFLSKYPEADAINQAQLSIDGNKRIDWILVKGFEVVRGRELPRGVSDHPFYAVSLKRLP